MLNLYRMRPFFQTSFFIGKKKKKVQFVLVRIVFIFIRIAFILNNAGFPLAIPF